MECSHVIRSQEFLPSVPKFLNLYEALAINRPKLATLPYVMAPDGRRKLSKRDGAKDILDYKQEGYLPEALINFLATLGWNDGSDQEVFSLDELLKKFSLARVQKSGAKFDERRLEWMNGYYIRTSKMETLAENIKDFWPETAKNYADSYRSDVLSLVKDRLKRFSELPELTSFFFAEPSADLALVDKDPHLKKISHSQQKDLLKTAKQELENSDFSEKNLQQNLNDLLDKTHQTPRVLFSLIRVATTWSPASPELAPTLRVLGKKRSIERLDRAIKVLGSQT